MVGMEDAVEEVSALSRSKHRVRLLDWLAEHGRLHRNDIRARCDADRTTVVRNLELLEEHGWIERNNHHYVITPAGEIISQQFSDLITVVQLTQRLQPILKWLPLSDLDTDLTMFEDATVVTPDPANPYAPVNRHIDAMDAADRFRCILPAVGLQPMTIAHELVVERGCTHEIIVDLDVADTLRSDPAYNALYEEMLDTGRFTGYVSTRPCTYYLGVTDDLVQIGVEDGNGMPRGLIELPAHSPDVAEWADRLYARHKQHSEPLHIGTAPKS